MKTSLFNIKSKVEKLNYKQKKELIDFIKNSYSIFDEISHVDKCPVCGSKHIVKNGTRNQITRYICRACGKSFTYKSNTILQGIHELNKWNNFVEDFLSLNISTIKEIKVKLDISTQTAINWRHKLLSALAKKENTFCNESIEFDETYFRISRKGRKDMPINNKPAYKEWRKSLVGDNDYMVKVFVSYGRENEHLDFTVSHMGRSKLKHLTDYFSPEKFNHIKIISDKHPTYKGFCKRNNIPHETFNSKEHATGENNQIHNQTINAYMRDFKFFVNRYLKGVSTKYLPAYAKWFEFITNAKKAVQKNISKVKFNLADTICNNILSDFNGLSIYRMFELNFEQFLKDNGRTDYGTCKNHYYAA